MPYNKQGDYEFTTHRNMAHRAIFWTGVFVVLCLAVSLVGWRIGWFFKEQNANREAHVIRKGYSNQQTLREQITKNIGDVSSITVQIAQLGDADPATSAALKAQRKAIINIGCEGAVQISGDPLPADQATWVAQNCLNGSINPNSLYYAP